MLDMKNFQAVKEIFEQNLSGHLEEEESSKSIQQLRQYREDLPGMINLIVLDFYYQQKQSYEDTQLEVFFGNLRDFLDELIEKKIIRERELLISLDADILDQIDFIDQKSLKKKMMQIYTLKNFKQDKYNLLCESTSGYSTLISKILLSEDQNNPRDIYDELKKIIGYYNLDPNKTIEIIIDVLRCYSSQININFDINNQPHLQALIHLLQDSNKENIQIIILQRILNLDQKNRSQSLLNIFAYLCKLDLLDYKFVYNNLHPKADEIIDNLKDKNESSMSLFKEAFTIRLFKTEEQEQYNKQRIDGLEKKYTESLNKSQKLEFLNSLVNVNNYKEFKQLYDNFGFKIHFRKIEFFLESLLKIFNNLLNVFLKKQQSIQISSKEFQLVPLYRDKNNIIEENLDMFLERVQELLNIITTNISYDQESFSNLLKLLQELKKYNKQNFINKNITEILLPSLFLKTLKPQQKLFCLSKIQQYLFKFSYIERFTFYQNIQENFIYENLYIMNPFVVNETKNFLNTICAGQNKEQQNQEKMKELLEENPFFVGLLLIREIQKYKSLINILVASFSDTNYLIKEIILWIILNELQNIQIQDGDKISNKFQLLCTFSAKFLQQNYELQMQSILTYLLNKLSITEGKDYLFFLTFKSILEEILGYQIVHEANSTQQAGSLGGINLQVCLFYYSKTFINSQQARKKFSEILFSLKINLNDEIEFSYFWIFYFHLCKTHIRTLYQASTFSIKINNTLVDQIHETKQLLFDLLKLYDTQQIGLTIQHLNFVLQNSMALLPADVLNLSSIMFRIYKQDLNKENFEEYFNLIKKNSNNIFQYEKFKLESIFIQNYQMQNFDLNKKTILLWYLNSSDIYYPQESYQQMIDKYSNILQLQNQENFEIPRGYQSQQQYFSICQQIKNNLENEQNTSQQHIAKVKVFIKEHCYEKIENNHQFIYQGILLKLSRSTQEAYLCSQLYQMALINHTENYNEFINKNFRMIIKLIPCLNGFTQNESLHFAQFFSFTFNINQYIGEQNFNDEVQKQLQKFDTNKQPYIKEKDVQKTLQNKFKKIIEIVQKDFSKSSPVFAKNILIFFKSIMNIFPKSIQNIDMLLVMFQQNEDFINLYEDLKLSCNNYRKYLEINKQRQMDILYPNQNQQEQNSPQQSKASFTKRSQKSFNKKTNSPESSRTYNKKYNNRNRDQQRNFNNRDSQRYQGNRNYDNRQKGYRRNYRDNDRKYYRKKNQFNLNII